MSPEENMECIVCERPLHSDVFMRIKYEDEWVRLCCPLCSEAFDKRKDFYILRRQALKADEAIRKKQKYEEEL